MDAKGKMSFINSVDINLLEKNIKCPKCGTINKSEDNFCMNCGSKLKLDGNNPKKTIKTVIPETKVNENEYEEKFLALASELPSWNIEPRHILVRRRDSK